MNKEKIMLEQAFSWVCPQCGTKNFESGVVCELTPDELQEIKDDLGVGDGEVVGQPEKVTCCKCKEIFETMGPEDFEINTESGER
jgi:hypothetical protein